MQFGIHLPHAGEQATPERIRRAAMRAEELGLDDVWVSEHIIVPRATFPRSPLFFDPVLSLTWAAAVTKRVRLGTSVLVLPMRHPLPLAKELATLQNFSEGRLILGAGVGWLEAEFAALGAPFHERGRRTDEGIAMMRAVWSQDPVTFRAKHIATEITEMTMQPLPVRPIPIWFGALRSGLQTQRAHRRRLARQPADAGRRSADNPAPTPRPARAGIYDFDAHPLERQGPRGIARPARRVCCRRRPARDGAPAQSRYRRLGRSHRRRRSRRLQNLRDRVSAEFGSLYRMNLERSAFCARAPTRSRT